MKKTIYALAASVLLLAPATVTAQKTPKVEFVFPDEMAPDIQVQYRAMAEKGLILYQLTCAKCHNDKVKGKDLIPDFTIEQLELYQIRIANATHERELTGASMSAEELSLITTFFMYKKPNEGRRK